jgi:hypothetical protein
MTARHPIESPETAMSIDHSGSMSARSLPLRSRGDNRCRCDDPLFRDVCHAKVSLKLGTHPACSSSPERQVHP